MGMVIITIAMRVISRDLLGLLINIIKPSVYRLRMKSVSKISLSIYSLIYFISLNIRL